MVPPTRSHSSQHVPAPPNWHCTRNHLTSINPDIDCAYIGTSHIPTSSAHLLPMSVSADDSTNSTYQCRDSTQDTLSSQQKLPLCNVLMGSFNQNHLCFGMVRNKQCGAISLIAVIRSHIKSVFTWTCADLDNVVIEGTHLYTHMQRLNLIGDKCHGYIAIHELPKHLTVWNTHFNIDFMVAYSGVMHDAPDNVIIRDIVMPFHEALNRALFINNVCLLTISASTYAIV